MNSKRTKRSKTKRSQNCNNNFLVWKLKQAKPANPHPRSKICKGSWPTPTKKSPVSTKPSRRRTNNLLSSEVSLTKSKSWKKHKVICLGQQISAIAYPILSARNSKKSIGFTQRSKNFPRRSAKPIARDKSSALATYAQRYKISPIN